MTVFPIFYSAWVFSYLPDRMAVFAILRNTPVPIEKLKVQNSRIFLSSFFVKISLSLTSSFVVFGGFDCTNPEE